MLSSEATHSSIMQGHRQPLLEKPRRRFSHDSSSRLSSRPIMESKKAAGQHQSSSVDTRSDVPASVAQNAHIVPSHLQINALAPQSTALGLVSPTTKAFQKLTVSTPKQKRRKGIYGLEELLDENATVESQSGPHEDDGQHSRCNDDDADDDGDDDEDYDDDDDGDTDGAGDGFPLPHHIQRHNSSSTNLAARLSTASSRPPQTPSKYCLPPPHVRQLVVDIDRDSAGRRLSAHRTPTTSKHAFGCLPVRKKQPSRATKYTVPDPHHGPAASSTLKRKRQPSSSSALPPVSHPYTRSNKPDFSVFSGFLLYPELCLHLATHLPIGDLISLYAISRDFHTIIDARFTTVMLSIATRRARESSRVFPFRCYARLCRTDPVARLPHPDPRKAAAHIPRMVPSFRWLKMVMYREAVVHEIMALMAEDGVPLPRRCGLALKKMWFLMDIPDNARRVGYIHNRHVVSDLDLYFIVCTIVKMDMRFNDPVGAEKRDGLRRLLLAQRSLSVWLRVLKGEMWRTKLDVLRAWLRWKYEPLPPAAQLGGRPVTSIFGVPLAECGKMCKEYWGLLPANHPAARRLDARGNKMLLMRPDQLVLRELVRRGLRCRGHYMKCLLYGYIDLRTLQNLEPRGISRRVAGWDVLEYGVDGLWGTGVGAVAGGQISRQQGNDESPLADEIGMDDMLDLGPAKEVSDWCVIRQGMGATEKKVRKDVEAISTKMMALWEEGRPRGERPERQ
ncbi:hypothetical protein DV737_g1274, partial [Chaetothyriales sp. CBS 132003]